MTYSIRATVLILATCVTTRAVTSPEEAYAACALENDAVASCDESWDDASRRPLGGPQGHESWDGENYARWLCFFGGPSLAACDARDTCGSEYRAYLSCYYRALCEDPTRDCATAAPSSSPAPTEMPTESPAPSSSPAPTATPVPTYEIRGCKRRLLRHTDVGDRPEAHRLLRCPPDGARGLTVGFAAAAWLLIA